MRYSPLFLMALSVLSACNQEKRAPQVITASTDGDGKQHAAQIQLTTSATVTCVSATGNSGSAAKCNINGASVAPPTTSVTATDKVYLFCEGSAPLTCSAKVE